MDDAWRHKLPSTWQPAPPLPAAATAAPPGPVDEVTLNFPQLANPFVAQRSRLQDRPIDQETFVKNSFNIDFSKLGKTGVGDSGLALLAANLHNVQHDMMQFSNSRSVVDKLHHHNGGGSVRGVGCGMPPTHVAPSNVSHVNNGMWNGELFSVVASRPQSMPISTRSSNVDDNLQVAGSGFNGLRSPTPVCVQASQNIDSGIAYSSPRLGCPISNIQSSRKIPLEAIPATFHDVSTRNDRPRVCCLNTVGELIISEMGHLGVLCFCHSLCMSVAKFCEHSGSSSVCPGDAVCLENGMTIAEWCNRRFGIRANKDGNGLDWLDGSSAKGGLLGLKPCNIPPLSRNPGTFQPLGALGGSGRCGETWNKNVHPNHSYIQLAGQAALDKSSNKFASHVYQRVNSDIGRPPKADNHGKRAMKENPGCNGLEASLSTLIKEAQNVEPQSFSHSFACTSSFRTPCTTYTRPTTEKTINQDYGTRGTFPGEPNLLHRDAASSHIELSLGQPSQHHQASLGSISATMQTHEFGERCHSQNLPLHKQPTSGTVHCRNTEKPCANFHPNSSETSIFYSRKHPHVTGSVHASNDPEAGELTANATSNSAISLFLSHLNYAERSNHSQAADIITDDNENSMARTVDNETLFAKCYLPGVLESRTHPTERKSEVNELNNSKHMEKGKGLKVACNSNKMSKPGCFVEPTKCSETIPLASCGQRYSTIDDRKHSLYLHQQSNILQTAAAVIRNPDQCENVSFCQTRDCFDHRSSTNPLRYVNATLTSPKSDNPTILSSKSPMNLSELTSALVSRKDSQISQHLQDEKLRFLNLRNMAELSEEEQSKTSLESGCQHGRLCCLSGREMERNAMKDVIPEEYRQLACCGIQPNMSRIAARSVHSCSSCQSGGGFNMFTCDPDFSGPKKCLNCTARGQRISMCPREQNMQCPSCHICGSNGQASPRLGRISTNCRDTIRNEMSNPMATGPRCSTNHSCTVWSNRMMGCHAGDNNFCAIGEHCNCVEAKKMRANITCAEDYMLQDRQRINLKHCECFQKHVFMKNGSQAASWRDAPSNVIGNSAAEDKPAQLLNARRIHSDQLTTMSSKDVDKGPEPLEEVKGQQVSNACSGSSAPAVTQVSVEVNNMESFAVEIQNSKPLHDSVVDEGSQIEICGSSDEAHHAKEWEEALSFGDNLDLGKAKSKVFCLPRHSSGNFMKEPNLEGSSSSKEEEKDTYAGAAAQDNRMMQQEMKCKAERRKRRVKWRRLNSSNPISGSKMHLPSAEERKSPLKSDSETQRKFKFSCGTSSIKRRRSLFFSSKSLSWKSIENYHKLLENDRTEAVEDDHKTSVLKPSAGEEGSPDRAVAGKKRLKVHSGNQPKHMLLGCTRNSINHGVEVHDKKVRPVVCGKLGIISSGLGNQLKPPKIVSLSLILKKSRRHNINRCEEKNGMSSTSESKSSHLSAYARSCDESFLWKKQHNNEGSSLPIMETSISKGELSSTKTDGYADEVTISKREKKGKRKMASGPRMHHEASNSQSYKETRKRSLSTLFEGDKNATQPKCFLGLGEDDCSNVIKAEDQHSEAQFSKKILSGASIRKDPPSYQDLAGKKHQIITRRSYSRSGQGHRYEPSLTDPGAFCCVCGSSNSEEVNQLLECKNCYIKVHQACYGVSKVPKSHWCCRPCKSGSSSIVCVLCGYEGGAMTRALKTQSSVKSLLKAWKFGNEDRAKLAHDISKSKSQALNSIVAGVFDQSVTQWVHMVCGLWTPGTRCPNVVTMSAFDVSGALPARKNMVCSICNRAGGSCIQCRVLNCSVYFHPWCAHLKGLLQSEIEGDDNEMVGFYGRCIAHATFHCSFVDSHLEEDEDQGPINKEFTCARTEGFKGRKKKEGLIPNHQKPDNDGRVCIVTQDQINAWIHINAQKSCTRGVAKPAYSDVECDFRKEYIRYKQKRGWKHLVVYKSGIHALGLYTSQFIARGAMVVEYVGEIVGLRVADKREIEYESGRRLQYKSACYFFRIDQEHIIDATRKGGIARFVNHSCLPNCVAKIISIRNEKKVVFFAERDINPGEEITYDYHFNNEDEGKKIPCFCNSRNCRRYLN